MPQPTSSFSRKTYSYFGAALKNHRNKAWFDEHRQEYQEAVHLPFIELIRQLNQKFSKKLPKIDFLPKKIARPVRKITDPTGGLVRSHATAFFLETPTSRFEWNPGIYISIGALADDNIIGVGLYSVSSRQMNLLRDGIIEDFNNIDAILSAKKLITRWGGLAGELYKRFPRGFDEASPTAKYLKHKQFFLSQRFSNKEVSQQDFFKRVISDIDCCIPLLSWLRSIVGTYNRSSK